MRGRLRREFFGHQPDKLPQQLMHCGETQGYKQVQPGAPMPRVMTPPLPPPGRGGPVLCVEGCVMNFSVIKLTNSPNN